MFSKSKPSQNDVLEGRPVLERNGNGGSGRATFSVIGEDVTITGNIKASVDLHVDGRIDGDVDCASLMQGQGSTIKGNIIADVARISGIIQGSVNARELIIEHSAQVKGDVTYETISIAQGGQVEGSFAYKSAGSMTRQHELQVVSAPAHEEEEAA